MNIPKIFENIEEYYEYLENDSSLLFDINITYSLINLRDKITEDELKLFCTGELSPKLTLKNEETFPNLKFINDNIEYFKMRAENVKNPKYKAKYNHLLWESNFKHSNYAEQAIENYFLFINGISIPIDDNISHHAFEVLLKNLFILCQTINYKKEESIQIFISLLGLNKINGYKEYSLMNYFVEEGKKINIETLKTFYEYSKKVIDNGIYPDFEGDYLKLLIVLCLKLKTSPKPYHIKLAEFHIKESEKLAGSFIIHEYYLKALAHYQKAGDKKKIEEVSVMVEKAKQNMDFKSYKIELNDEITQKYWDSISKLTDELIEKGLSNDIYHYIMFSNIFPKAEDLKINVQPIMFEFINVMNFDINKNVSGTKKSGINPYYIHVVTFSINHLGLVFIKGIKNGKISFQTLIDYFKNHSWYGQNFTFINADGEVEGFNWIELLSPALLIFFNQFEIDIKLNKNDNYGYILPVDSLVIKFEGLLREFSRIIGAQTIEINENKTEERISFEKLLENDKLKELIPKDDIALFKFLFTTEGMNLRNNIAHCFYKTKNYSSGIMLLLIAALLKLSNFKLKPKE